MDRRGRRERARVRAVPRTTHLVVPAAGGRAMRLRDQLDRDVAHLQADRAHHLPGLRHAARIVPQTPGPGLSLPWVYLLWTIPRAAEPGLRRSTNRMYSSCTHHALTMHSPCTHHAPTMHLPCAHFRPLLVSGLRGVRDHLRRAIAHGSELLGADPLRSAQLPSREDRHAPGDPPYWPRACSHGSPVALLPTAGRRGATRAMPVLAMPPPPLR